MESERRSMRIGLAVILCALVLRVLSSGVLEPVAAFFGKPEVAAFLLYMETGRVLRIDSGQEAPFLPVQDTQPTQAPQEDQLLSFDENDAQAVAVSNHCDYAVDLQQLLAQPLQWQLRSSEPTVLILHTHATESYTQTPENTYTESSAYRTLDTRHNVVRVGEALAQALQSQGIQVIHDTTLHDSPSYTGAYSNARKTIKGYLEQYPSIRMVLDIHRDAVSLDDATQLSTASEISGAERAGLMMVVGTDAGGLNHPDWQSNMALAVKLHALLEKNWPGICRPISFRTERFNQDMSAGAMLVEVGAAGDSLEDALAAAELLGQAIGLLAEGTATADSTS